MPFLSRTSALPWACATRTTLVTVLLFLWTIEAVTIRPLDAEQLATPSYQRALAGLQAGLSAIGISTSTETLEHSLIATNKLLRKGRRKLLDQVQPVYDFAGMEQRWSLFSRVGRNTQRLQIEGQDAAGTWRVLYRAQQTDLVGLAPQLAFRRMRGVYDGCRRDEASAQYDGLVDWVAQKLLGEHHELTAIRVSIERLRVGNLKHGATVLSVEHERVRERAS